MATHFSSKNGPLRLVVIGMVHGHVAGPLAYAQAHPDQVQIVGVYERDRALFERLAGRYGLSAELRYDDLARMLDETKPEAASVMTSIRDHRAAVEACAPGGVHALLEKPLAFSIADAKRMAELSRRYGVLVLTNYETSWYASVREAQRMVESGEMGPVRRLVFRHGHPGPIEIGCGPEFVSWLTDPQQAGGGAVIDFGCYGAILATWMMNGAAPTHVVASRTTLKPDKYPHVDDDATIVLTYPTATALIQASWDWTHDNKEMDVYAERGSIHAAKWDALTVRKPNKPAEAVKLGPMTEMLGNEWEYLRHVVRGECPVDPLSGLEMNLTAVGILEKAVKNSE